MIKRSLCKPVICSHWRKITRSWNVIHNARATYVNGSSMSAGSKRYGFTRLTTYIHQWSTRATASLKNPADNWVVATGVALSRLGSQLNRISGYQDIEALKQKVVEQGVFKI